MNERIEEIKKRLLATTPGIWEAKYAEDEKFNADCPSLDPCIVVKGKGTYIAQTTYDTLSTTCRTTMYADAEFIAHAKNDMKYLLSLLKITQFK